MDKPWWGLYLEREMDLKLYEQGGRRGEGGAFGWRGVEGWGENADDGN